MAKYKIKHMKEVMTISFTTKGIYTEIKKKYSLTYEELFILTFILVYQQDTYNVKEILLSSKFHPYYITNAMQK
ncbi:MarR family transcriptional regulator, partial [Staphylococcus pseudintermedius]|uniref:transcriptional regulator, SarA/Rot family n=1 Tax=Staphylococcus pseudintermedius TaxID=283734 RepID=UPI000E3ACBD4